MLITKSLKSEGTMLNSSNLRPPMSISKKMCGKDKFVGQWEDSCTSFFYLPNALTFYDSSLCCGDTQPWNYFCCYFNCNFTTFMKKYKYMICRISEMRPLRKDSSTLKGVMTNRLIITAYTSANQKFRISTSKSSSHEF